METVVIDLFGMERTIIDEKSTNEEEFVDNICKEVRNEYNRQYTDIIRISDNEYEIIPNNLSKILDQILKYKDSETLYGEISVPYHINAMLNKQRYVDVIKYLNIEIFDDGMPNILVQYCRNDNINYDFLKLLIDVGCIGCTEAAIEAIINKKNKLAKNIINLADVDIDSCLITAISEDSVFIVKNIKSLGFATDYECVREACRHCDPTVMLNILVTGKTNIPRHLSTKTFYLLLKYGNTKSIMSLDRSIPYKWHNLLDNFGRRLIYYAARHNDVYLTKYLVDKGSILNGDSVGRDPLCGSMIHGNEELMELLYADGENVNNEHLLASAFIHNTNNASRFFIMKKLGPGNKEIEDFLLKCIKKHNYSALRDIIGFKCVNEGSLIKLFSKSKSSGKIFKFLCSETINIKTSPSEKIKMFSGQFNDDEPTLAKLISLCLDIDE